MWDRASTTFDAFFTGQVGPHVDTEGFGFQYNWQRALESARKLLSARIKRRRRHLVWAN
jgi:hypothetical protein